MEKFIFIINFWLKFLYQIYILTNLKLLFFFKFWLYIKKYLSLLYFIFLNQNFEYNKFLKIYLKLSKKVYLNNFFELKKGKIIKNYIQKGYKFEKLGIYNSNIYYIYKNLQKKKKSFIFLIRFKRKNLFLTLLNNNGDVLCKTNIGSCGFKKKVKYTGYAIKRTSRIFLEKILRSLIYNIYYIYYVDSFKKKKKKKTNIKLIKYISNKKSKYIKIIKKYKLKVLNLKKRKKINILNTNLKYKILKKIFKKKQNLKIIKKKKNFNLKFLEFKKLNLISYRNYDKYIKNYMKNKLKIILRIKSNLKFWGFRFVIYGLSKQFHWFRNLETRLPIPHSTSLRLKKKRRI
jgi:hypothetical protein